MLHRHKRHLTPEERQQIVLDVIDRYIDETGRPPDAGTLRRLGDYLLIDVLTDQYKHYRKDDYPFLTQKQIERRDAKLTSFDEENAH